MRRLRVPEKVGTPNHPLDSLECGVIQWNDALARLVLAGKTTLLNALAAHIPDSDHVIVIEETSEIHLNKPNVLRLEARRAQAPLGQEAPLPPVTIADLLRASLRPRIGVQFSF
jgi:hypothetical protein